MNSLNHLLLKYKILSSFNITKKLKVKDIEKMREKLKSTCKNDEEIEEKIEKLIKISVQDYSVKKNIPGIIIDNYKQNFKQKPVKKEITNSSNLIEKDFHKLSKEKQQYIIAMTSQIIAHSKNFNLTSLDLFFFIQILLSELQVSAEEMNKYNKKYYNGPPKVDDDDEDDDDDDEDDDLEF